MNRFISYLLVFAVMAMTMPFAAGAATDKGTKDMEAKLRKEIQANKALSAKVKAFTIKSLLPYSTHAIFVKAVLAQNAKKMTLAQIQDVDKKWMAAEAKMPIQTELQENECGKELDKIVEKLQGLNESFVMDDQGANVCMSGLTSDYWQGDEAKWQNSFNGGKGGVDAGKVSFDKSANQNLQQVSLPIIGKGGKIIGAVTWGVVVDKL
jgi:hypothetical protein